MLAGVCGNGQTSEQISWETGLDQDLFTTMQLDLNGAEIAVFFVYLNGRAFESDISPGLAEKLRPYEDTNALYVNVTIEGSVPQIGLDPTRFVVRQFGTEPVSTSEESWAEITTGFLDGWLQPNPDDAAYGSGSIGVLRLGDTIDPRQPFTIAYVGYEQRAVTLAVGPGAPIASGTGPGSDAAIDPSYNDPRQESVASGSIEIPLLSALLDETVGAEEMSALLGIPTDTLHLFSCGGETDRLRILLVELNEPRVGEEPVGGDAEQETGRLWDVLAPLVGTGAVMVWAASPTGAEFTPYAFYLQQAGSTFLFFSRSSFVDLTEGFTQQRRLAAGEASAGIVLVHRGIDLRDPYTMTYCGVSSSLGGEGSNEGGTTAP